MGKGVGGRVRTALLIAFSYLYPHSSADPLPHGTIPPLRLVLPTHRSSTTRSTKCKDSLTPRLWASHHALVARSKPMEKVKADRKTVETKTEFRLKNVL
jgi:hypothetical protein